VKPIAPPTGDPRPEPASVGAVFVTYHPDANLYEHVRAIGGQVREILVVDNGSTEDELIVVRRLVKEGLVEALFNGQNLGQATALNQGFEWGKAKGLPWILTLDQDTRPTSTLVDEAARVYDAHEGLPLAAIGAGWVLGPGQRFTCLDPGGVEVPAVITSGSLHSVAAFRSVGPFRDDFFIDYVDTEYCLRARSAGYVALRSCLPTMQHQIGSPTRHRLVYRTVQPSNHSAFRRYFITRNRMYVWRWYLRAEPGYILFDMRAATKELIKLVLFERQRSRKIRAMLRGAHDAIRGVTGPIPASLLDRR
jgi:rhamnosyltransferase